MLTYETDFTSYIHHIVAMTLAGLLKIAMTPAQADIATLLVAVLESTSPVLHSTWLLKQAGYSEYPFFKYIAGFAAVFFGLMRVGVVSWIVATKMDKASKFVFTPLLALNVYWFYKIVKMLMKIVAKKEEGALSTEQSHEA